MYLITQRCICLQNISKYPKKSKQVGDYIKQRSR